MQHPTSGPRASRTQILVVIPLPDDVLAQLRREHEVHYVPDGLAPGVLQKLAKHAIRGVVTNGSRGFTAAQIAALPQLEIVCAYGAGYENIDLETAHGRKLAVTHAPGINDSTVADHALALMLAVARGIVTVDRAVREGKWKTSRAERPTLSGSKLGLVGLGNIGGKIAARASAFEMQIGYHARSPRAVAWRYYESVVELAQNSDFLVVACPGGSATRHLIDARVLQALGHCGFLVNIARGSVVDTKALLAALQAGTVAGAGIDVLEGEPEPPAELLELANVVITPHMAGRSPAVSQAQTTALLANLGARFAGQSPLSPVPGF